MVFALLSVNCGAIEITTGPGHDIAVPDSIAAGAEFEVTGTGFWTECGGIGCASCPAPSGAEDVQLTLLQGERSWVLDTVDANGNGSISARVRAPDDVASGDAFVQAGAIKEPVTVSAP